MEYEFTDGTIAFIQQDTNLVCMDSHGTQKPVALRSLLNNLVKAGNAFGNEEIYDQFCLIYDLTREEFKEVTDSEMFQLINDLCMNYGERSLIVAKTFTLLFLQMKAFFLGYHAFVHKVILRLQVMEVLTEGQSVQEVLTQTETMSLRELFLECCKRAFGDFDADEVDCPEILDTDCEAEEWGKCYAEKRRSYKGNRA